MLSGDQFVLCVRQMRHAQKDYDKSSKGFSGQKRLKEKNAKEKLVDKWLETYSEQDKDAVQGKS